MTAGGALENDAPIFVAGADRSGIGLLGEILECNADVSMTRRTNFWPRYVARYTDLSRPGALDRCLDEIHDDRRMRPLTPDRPALETAFADGPSTFPRLFALLQRQRMERVGASRWGDKSLGSERDAPAILAAFPGARFVHVVRDPRDRCASVARHRGLSRGGLGRAVAVGVESMDLARTHAEAYPDRYVTVRYEDLVREPATLEGLRGFLGLGDMRRDTGSSPVPLTDRSVGRHRRDLTDRDRRFVEAYSARLMAQWGYETDRGVGDRGRLVEGMRAPVHAVQYSLAAAQHRAGVRR